MSDRDELTLADLGDAIRARWRTIGLVGATITAAGFLYAILATPLYTASTVVIRADEDENALSSLTSGLGSIAALAGVNVRTGSSSREANLAVLQSRELGEQFMVEQSVLPYLFPEQWDADSATWRVGQPTFFGRVMLGFSRWLAATSGDEGWTGPRSEPSVGAAYERFNRIRRISQDPRTSLTTVSFVFRDPDLAATWANEYVALANRAIREQAVEESSRALKYLNDTVDQTRLVGLRETIFRLVQTHLERITLANVREEFAFRVIDKAVTPERRSFPQRSLVVMASALLGGVVGVGVAFALQLRTRRSSRAGAVA